MNCPGFFWKSKAEARREAQFRQLAELVIRHEELIIRQQRQLNLHLEILAKLSPDTADLHSRIVSGPSFDQATAHARDLDKWIHELRNFFET